jgi:hypothetical protein
MEEIIYNFTKNMKDDELERDYADELKKINENVEHTRNVITPFIPYLLLYSIYLQNN